MAVKWWQKPVRMTRVDYVPDFSAIKDLPLEEVARTHRDEWGINCEWIVGTPGFEGKGHLTTFEADGYSICPGFEHFDYLRTYTPIAHKYGIRILAYLNMHWYSYDFADAHEGWEQVMIDGRGYGRVTPLYGNGTTLCINSPWRDWAFGLIREAMKTGIDGVFMDGPVIYPECCYCESCRELFRKESGSEPPGADWLDPVWRQFVSFREDSMARFLSDARASVLDVNPDGAIFLNAEGWAPHAYRYGLSAAKLAPYQTFSGSEAFFDYDGKPGLYAAAMMGKYLRATSSPAVVFTHDMNGKWHYLPLAPEELRHNLVQTTASGANPWIAYMQSKSSPKPRDSRVVLDTFGFFEEHDDLLAGGESVCDVGILFGEKTALNYLSRQETIYDQLNQGKESNLSIDTSRTVVEDSAARKTLCEQIIHSAYVGYFRSLTRNHFLFDILLDGNLNAEHLKKFKAIVLPDAACLAPEAASAVREFVHGGGALLASFEAGMYDGQGNYTEAMLDLMGLEDVTGCFPKALGENYSQAIKEHLGYEPGDLVERSPYALSVKALESASALSLFLEPVTGYYVPMGEVSSHPALVTRKYGKGQVIYFPEAMGYFAEMGMISAERRITGALNNMIPARAIETNAPPSVSVEMYRHPDSNSVVIHLVNNSVDARPVSCVIPVNNVELAIALPSAPLNVSALRENESLHSEFRDGMFHVTVPQLKLYELVVIQMADPGSSQ